MERAQGAAVQRIFGRAQQSTLCRLRLMGCFGDRYINENADVKLRVKGMRCFCKRQDLGTVDTYFFPMDPTDGALRQTWSFLRAVRSWKSFGMEDPLTPPVQTRFANPLVSSEVGTNGEDTGAWAMWIVD